MIRFCPMPTDLAEAYRRGAGDAYGLKPERHQSDGDGMPCRHCLDNIEAGKSYMTLAYRPFRTLHPYAETGPIFLHADACPAYQGGASLPPILTSSPDYLVKAYGANERIVYGTGAVTASAEIAARAETLLARDDIAFVDIRSARNNCFQCRIVRAEG
ncbi:hypothetical protein BJF93_09810 [Xaviernesmea oryzae]|uniref:DUF1203 domain-containing protein n=1 Tax=Xaviernesmea oryzae TaxID=464029 RepID=A0A1Q9AWP8_9HYPH|nr:DUF1203 domain-containing protein [Xaviernesmea oryzae]OLP59892.1 hypothetical protein BJF93_09810 [Xaviernesmea oryzae]SEK46873.1 Protein of unknown function [Xaviernesmea oryzae]